MSFIGQVLKNYTSAIIFAPVAMNFEHIILYH